MHRSIWGREARSKPENMMLNGITLEKLQDRTSLMKSLDRFQRDADHKGQMEVWMFTPNRPWAF